MNYSQWYSLKSKGRSFIDWTYYNKSHRLMKQYNESNKLIDENLKTEIHHLRDTEEQRKYNDEHYELWGFNEDGTFEYGKYVIFVTHEEHMKKHYTSEETKHKISESNKGKKRSDDTRKKLSESHKGIPCLESTKEKFRQMYKGRRLCPPMSDETKQKISAANKGKVRSDEFKNHLSDINSGVGNPMYGKSPSNKGKPMSDEQKLKISKANSGKNNPMYGKSPSAETRLKLSNSLRGRIVSESHRQNIINSISISEKVKNSKANLQRCKEHFNTYIKQNNIHITWNQFQKLFTNDYLLLKLILIVYLNFVDRSKL